MGRVSEKHRRYRTKEQIVRDIVYVLNAPLSYGTKWAVFNDVMWVWTEFNGKYNGCSYWSEPALEQRKANPKAKLRHEHIVPKAVVIKMLFDLQPATEEAVREICEKLLIGVVVTREEDSKLNAEYGRTMPDEFFSESGAGYRDPWLRYKRCGIRVICRDKERQTQ